MTEHLAMKYSLPTVTKKKKILHLGSAHSTSYLKDPMLNYLVE